MRDHLFPENPVDPRTLIEETHKYFVGLNSQGVTEIVATYQTVQKIALKVRREPSHFKTDEFDVILKAAKARMHYLVASEENRSERKRMRILFLEATNDGGFQSILDSIFG